jgi:4-diphosphocytidyl-2-C-methyl-D-erythritol kinase
MSREEMADIAAKLGSDVPFMLNGGTAIGTGHGDQLTSALSRGTYHWVLALSTHGLSTPAVYAVIVCELDLKLWNHKQMKR